MLKEIFKKNYHWLLSAYFLLAIITLQNQLLLLNYALTLLIILGIFSPKKYFPVFLCVIANITSIIFFALLDNSKDFFDSQVTALIYFWLFAFLATRHNKIKKRFHTKSKKYLSFYNDVPGMLHIVDKQGNIIHLSDAWLNKLGYKRDEVIGKKALTFFSPASQKEYRHKSSEMHRQSFQMVKKNGKFIDVLLSSSAQKDLTDNSTNSLEVVTDISEFIDLQQQQQQLGNILEHSLNETYICDLKNLKFIYVNKGTQQNLGYSMKELSKMTPLNISPELSIMKLNEVIKPLESGQQSTVQIETIHQRQDKSNYVARINFQISKFANKNVLVAFISDVSELKDTLHKLEKSKELFQLAVDGAEEGIWDWPNIDEDQQYWSPKLKELLGYQDKEIESTYSNFLALLHLEDKDPFRQLVKSHLAGRTSLILEIRLRCKNKEYKWFLIKGNKYPNEKNLRITGSLSDISNIKNTEEQLKKSIDELTKSNIALERFVHLASHDLREPLRTISSCSQLLAHQNKAAFNDSSKKLVNYIESGVSRMEALIENLLYYSKINQLIIPFEKVNLNEKVLTDVLSNLQYNISENKADIKIKKNLPEIYGDPLQLVQLFQNLISNALKYAKSDLAAKIDISCKKQKDFWLFAVNDNGIGIAEEQQSKIFLPFHRVENTDLKGTGIGLAICQKVVEKHGGEIWVESAEGKGSTFFFTLPVYKKFPTK